MLDLFWHLDLHLNQIILEYGLWSYLILSLVIFCETGLVFTPFLPGDSLLFAAGALSAGNGLDPFYLFFLLTLAAIAGDATNYAVGYFLEEKVITWNGRFFKKEYLDRTHRFYEKYGNKTIVLARFVPIVRTFAPFLAGVGKMNYTSFASYNVIGAILWVAIFIFGGYFFGNISFVKKNFPLVILVIILLSVLPVLIEAYRERNRCKNEKA